MKTVDAFLCLHATSMCELFMPFNRTLIAIASTRYEIGRHDKESWMLWNENLRRIASHPHNTVAANNRYDQVGVIDTCCVTLHNSFRNTNTSVFLFLIYDNQEYIKYFTGIQDVLLLPNVCGYIKDRYSYHHSTTYPSVAKVKSKETNSPSTLKDYHRTASAVSTPLREEGVVSLDKAVLIAPARGVSGELSRQLHAALQNFITSSSRSTAITASSQTLTFAHIRDLYPHFQYSDLASHPAIAVLPYQVSFMSLFEFYRMEIPLFVPSLDLLTDWHMTYKVTLLGCRLTYTLTIQYMTNHMT